MQFIAGTLQDPLPPAPPLNLEAQLRDSQHCLAAADCAQLALMLANEKLRAHSYADALQRLQGQQAVLVGASSSSGAGGGGQAEGGSGDLPRSVDGSGGLSASAAGPSGSDMLRQRRRGGLHLRHRHPREAVERVRRRRAGSAVPAHPGNRSHARLRSDSCLICQALPDDNMRPQLWC